MEKIFTLLALPAGNSPDIGEFSSQKPVTGSFDVFWSTPEKRLSNQPRRRWYEVPIALIMLSI